MKKGSGRRHILTCEVDRCELRIRIGVGTLAHAAVYDPTARVTDEKKFAKDVARALMDELGEDGSSLLTNALDAAIQRAVDDGTEHFRTGFCPYPDKHAEDCDCEGSGGDR